MTARRTRLELRPLEDRSVPANLPTGFTEVAVATGLNNATAMEFSPNGDLWVLQQGGLIKRFVAGSTTADNVANLQDVGLRSEGERGVLGIAFSPDYATNKHVFIYYTSSDAPNPHNRVSRFTVNDTNAADYSFVDTAGDPAVLDEVVILDLDALSGATNHNGGAIHFGPLDGKLYVAVGDNANGAHAQNPNNRHGKMLRINADGSIPSDNPTTIAGIGTTSGLNRAIWAAGLRNPFTFSIHPDTGVMHINDVGQVTWEEVNVGASGANYGWPTTEGDFNQGSFPNFTRPLYAYDHGGGAFQGFAITGGAFYSPATNQFPAEYDGDYFFADFVSSWINVIDADGTNPRQFATGAGGTVDLRVSGDGSLYYLPRNEGVVRRIIFDGDLAPQITDQPDDATISEGDDATFTVAASGTPAPTFQWQMFVGGQWTDLPGETSATLTLPSVDSADEGDYRAVATNAAGSATSDPATLTVTANQSPTGEITIDSGLTNDLFIAGDEIAFSGTATDPEDGTLPASAYTWRVDYITSIDSGTPVVRPFIEPFSGVTSGTFTPAVTGPYTLADVAYRVTLTIVDSGGQSSTESFDVFPNVVDLTVATNPAGGSVTVDGQPYPSGTVLESVVGFQRPIGAPAEQSFNGYGYAFSEWSDGGAMTHLVTTPAADTTYTATYTYAVNINFQPAKAATFAGYAVDGGLKFADRGNGQSYGWNKKVKLEARDRNAANSPDQRYDTFIRVRGAGKRWEIAVPNGSYRVRVVSGDPKVFSGLYRTTVEGVTAVDGTPSAAQPWLEGTVEVTVSDGRLTLANGVGALRNKLNFIEIVSIDPLVPVPKPAPTPTAEPAVKPAPPVATPDMRFIPPWWLSSSRKAR